MREIDWIDHAFREAENNSAISSVKEVTRLEKCGCGQCRGQITKIYQEWAGWGKFNPGTRQNISKALIVIKKT